MMEPDLPTGEIHTTILFSLKLLLKARGIINYHGLQDEINSVRNTNHNLNPTYGSIQKLFSMFVAFAVVATRFEFNFS